MPKKKTLAELNEEYKKSEAKTQKLKEEIKRVAEAEEKKRNKELLEATLAWIDSYYLFHSAEDAIRWMQEKTEANNRNKAALPSKTKAKTDDQITFDLEE